MENDVEERGACWKMIANALEVADYMGRVGRLKQDIASNYQTAAVARRVRDRHS